MQRRVARAACAALLAASLPALATKVALRKEVGAPEGPGPSGLDWYVSDGQPELLGVTLNEVEQDDEVQALRLGPNSMAVPLEALARWRLRRPGGAVLRHEGRDHVTLESVPGLRWRVDPVTQTLVISAPSAAFVRNDFEVVASSRPVQAIARLGGYANHDLQWQRDGGDPGAASMLGGGLVELGMFSRHGNGHSTGVWRSANGQNRFTRLDTTWATDLPASITTLKVGDTIGTSGAWGRSVRFGGVQWATNFGVRPGTISFPMPAVRGEATVPSVLDLYINNTHQLQGKVPAGAFDLPDVPVATGQGQIRMVVRDLLGREQVIVQPYYVSPALLREGLRDFAVEGGWVRQDYGLESQRYGRPVVTATDRVGVSDGFTRELRAELLREQQTAGVSGVWLLRQMATAHATAVLSRGPAGPGWLAGAGVDHQSRAWSASLQGQTRSRDFVQVGQAALPGGSVRATLSANLATTLGATGVGLVHARQTGWQGERFASTSLSIGRSLGALGHLGISASRTGGSGRGSSIGVTLIQALGAETSASLGSWRSRDRTGASGTPVHETQQQMLQLQGSAPAGPGFGYQVQAERGSSERFSADASWNTPLQSFSAGVARAHHRDAQRLGASGGLAWMPEGVFPSRRIDGSFAVVQVGDYAGVRVLRDNQVVARTDARGHALVTGLRGFETNRLSVEAADLPLDAEVDQLHIAVAPGRGSGVSVRFPVRRTRAATLRLVTADGVPVPPGSLVRVEGGAVDYPVGYDGKLFVAGLPERALLRAEWQGRRCEAQIVVAADVDGLPELGTTACR